MLAALFFRLREALSRLWLAFCPDWLALLRWFCCDWRDASRCEGAASWDSSRLASSSDSLPCGSAWSPLSFASLASCSVSSASLSCSAEGWDSLESPDFCCDGSPDYFGSCSGVSN
jgi:hypothetical protein